MTDGLHHADVLWFLLITLMFLLQEVRNTRGSHTNSLFEGSVSFF